MRWQSARHTRIGVAIAALISGCVGVSACDAILLGDLHAGVCDEGEKRCASGNTLQTCEKSGQWNSGAPCDGQTCDPAARKCDGECAPGGKRCVGDTPKECDLSGRWAGGVACDVAAGMHCSGGACVVTCTPGDIRCLGENTPQICDAGGEWSDNGPLCLPCTGCDPSTGKCRTSPLPDTSPCQDPANKCILVGTCQSGVCNPTPDGSVDCVAAGPCSPGVCDPSTGTCAAMEGAPCDDGDVCTASSTCQAGICTSNPLGNHAWAHWDPQLAPTSTPPLPRYTWTKKVVHDGVTGLTWQREVPALAYSLLDAQRYCSCLNGAKNTISCDTDKIPGYTSGWRVPTRIELVSIVDYSQQAPAIDQVAFPGTPSEFFWLSPLTLDGSPSVPVVYFLTGNISYGSSVDTPWRVRCVR